MNRRCVWFALAVVVQLLILAAVPAKKAFAALTGTKVVLKVAPVDPYSIMSGYYVTLNYEISQPASMPATAESGRGCDVYVVLKPGPDGAWCAESVHAQRPGAVPSDRVVIRGRRTDNWRRAIEYGIESYYIPEDAREKIADDLREHIKDARVEVLVDRFGNAFLRRLLIQDRAYEY